MRRLWKTSMSWAMFQLQRRPEGGAMQENWSDCINFLCFLNSSNHVWCVNKYPIKKSKMHGSSWEAFHISVRRIKVHFRTKSNKIFPRMPRVSRRTVTNGTLIFPSLVWVEISRVRTLKINRKINCLSSSCVFASSSTPESARKRTCAHTHTHTHSDKCTHAQRCGAKCSVSESMCNNSSETNKRWRSRCSCTKTTANSWKSKPKADGDHPCVLLPCI